jgi:hypothetical protein
MFERFYESASVTVGTAAASSTAFGYKEFSGGEVLVPVGSSITVLTWYGSDDGVTYYALVDGFGVAIQSIVTAGQGCPIPDECFSNAFLKATDPVGGAVKVSRKS